ncbi:MAG: hypothetical protein J6B23_01940 [Clostridia bacterium]|nr:hypothetical protein [Clostridia bacterium]
MKSKKIIIPAILIILIFTSVVSMAFLNDWFDFAKENSALINNIDEVDISYLNSFSQNAEENMTAISDMTASFVAPQVSQKPDFSDISYEQHMSIEAYIVFMLKHSPSADEISQINSILKSGTTIHTLSQVYDFYLTTNDDFSIIAQIAALEDQFWGKHWIESAYNRITENSHGVLDKDDVEHYAETLNREDMEYANLLSRKGVYNVYELLDKRVNGESWNGITDEIFNTVADNSAEGSALERNSKFKALAESELTNTNLTAVYEISGYLSKIDASLSVDDITNDITQIETELKDKYNTDLVEAVGEVMQKLGIPRQYMTDEEYSVYYETNYNCAIENGLFPDDIKAFEQKGFSLEEIANASSGCEGDVFYVLKNLKNQREVEQ